jgi:cob(I)alamin adenosyltransferase
MPRDPNEPVRLTRIYTRGGDKGETSLGDGSRVSKLDPRVAAMGDVDELNSIVGWAGGLDRVQNELFDLGADMSVPYAGNEDRLRITDAAIERLEHEIEEANGSLPELKSFILPGGSERAARLFMARAVCRRAERAVLGVPDTNPLAAVYLRPALRARPRGERRSRRRRAAVASRFLTLPKRRVAVTVCGAVLRG